MPACLCDVAGGSSACATDAGNIRCHEQLITHQDVGFARRSSDSWHVGMATDVRLMRRADRGAEESGGGGGGERAIACQTSERYDKKCSPRFKSKCISCFRSANYCNPREANGRIVTCTSLLSRVYPNAQACHSTCWLAAPDVDSCSDMATSNDCWYLYQSRLLGAHQLVRAHQPSPPHKTCSPSPVQQTFGSFIALSVFPLTCPLSFQGGRGHLHGCLQVPSLTG